jgi:ABC-type glycerol-3-phosphate transport system substrate-binding protein
VSSVLSDLSKANKQYLNVSYTYYNPSTFDSSLLNALADNRGPDLILVSHERLVDMKRRIQPFSFESFPRRDVRNLYLDGAEIFAMNDGLYAYPIAVDPLMMYWNRDILGTEGFLEAPRTWESLVNSVFPKVIERSFDRSIQRSVVAMGEYQNVRNSFGIISALLVQGGSLGVGQDEKGKYIIQIQNSVNGTGDPLRSAADFYTRFSQPNNTLYSWNRSFAEDRQQFVAEELALYFGYASEGRVIEQINPNLNFDIAEIPQGANSTIRRTYGKFYGLSLLSSSDNVNGAIGVMVNLGSSQVADRIAIKANMVPAFRNSVSQGSNDNFGRVAYSSASIAMGWLSPNKVRTDFIFESMTRDINENVRYIDGATADVVNRLRNEY